ncbi:T9SS type B sorting domain-containing protein [Flavobacterium sp.]|uniref:Ig-like domain-containing protein n=1 Tax=Flavobacterium sp. TaxID=239 RepID=UPI0025E2987D|nr:T9SS type B sorting domain-containing protein [Flavobacterium sp.]
MKNSILLFWLILLFGSNRGHSAAQIIALQQPVSNVAPTLIATGNQTYCPGTSMKIVTSMTITDPDDSGIDAIYIQISSGYALGEDLLTLTGTHPNISTSWNATTGTLTLSGITVQPSHTELIAAIEDIEFSSSATNPTGVRNFSITVGQANYLPSNGHYYLYIPNIGITWSAAKVAAQNSTYYGLQGYLATITSAEEAQIAGEQTTGAGWIGGSDEQTESVWKWMTGPENGTTFWNGNFNGSTPNYAFWNNGEPNNAGDEDYAHITAPGVGIPGSWNDLSNTGESGGDYQPKGYIVEYGGMPGDPILNISTSTTITMASITSSTNGSRCGSGTAILQAISNTGTVNWYDAPIGGNFLGNGNSFTTPIISATTVFYAAAFSNGCVTNSRVAVTASVIPKPQLTYTTPYTICEESQEIIQVQTTSGILNWYESLTDNTPFFSGTNFSTNNLSQNTTFFIEANFNGCLSDRTAIDIQVFPAPILADETIELCEGETILLDAGNPNMIYLWSNGATGQHINSDGQTNYSVTVTTPAPGSCAKTKNFTLIYHPDPIISTVITNDLEVTIQTVQTGNFQYSLDGIHYQNANTFTVTEGGLYTAYVKEPNQCGEDQKPFVVISIPAFFTPNNDGINDRWHIKGMSYFNNAEVKIFDRFGKLITVLNSSNPSWDGTYNGQLLPSTDYWFVAKLEGLMPETRGHFSMKR